MFLKSIEIRGFKSFADKTELTFIKGVTTVVGPNGSGKSNISDAVRWVLGEQSIKSLRGGKMEDVIFAGTQYRKPVGLAQVALTLDNSDGALPIDYSDVTISRRLYRSGESEYYINNTHCRLKDIQELFMDTGIGKEGYSIIGQGKIDAILSGKPEERRGLLEEAAGIVKFKTRKEEAEKKLGNTEQNLIRIKDIIKTYEDRLEPLRLESEKAKAFLDFSQSLKEKEVNIIIYSLEEIKSKDNYIKQEIEKIQESIHSLVIKKDEYKNKLNTLENELENHEVSTQNNQQKFYELKSDYQNINSETDLIKERINNLQLSIEKNISDIKEIQDKAKNITETKNNQEEFLKQYQEEQLNINGHIEAYEKQIMDINYLINNNELLINQYKDESMNLLNQITNNKNDISILNNELQRMSKKIDELKSFCENNINSVKINSTTIAMLEKNVIEINNKIIDYENKIKNNKQEISKLNLIISKDEKQLKDHSISANKLEANYQMLLNLDKQYEGYNKSVKLLMQHINSGKIQDAFSKCYVLGEVINVKKDLETAIEIALGGAISDIITDNEDTAKKLIMYLRTNNIGRATFLPLSIIKGKKVSNIDSLKNAAGFIGIASNLIEYDKKFTNAIDYILGRTIIASNMDCALSIAKKTDYSYKIVTLTGETINPGGSLTGGSTFHKSTSIISRKREIEDLYIKLQEENNLINNLSSSVESNKKIVRALDEECLNLKDEEYKENIEITKLKGKIAAIASENDRLTKSLESSKSEIQILKKDYDSSREEITKKELSLNELLKNQVDNTNNLNEYEAQIISKSNHIKELKEKHTSLKIKKAQVDEIVLNKIRELERLSSELEELNKKGYTLENELANYKISISEGYLQIKNNDNKINSIKASIENYEETFRQSEIEKIRIKEAIKITNNILEENVLLLSKKEDEYHKQQVILAKLETEIESLYSRLNEEMGLTYAEALQYKTEVKNVDSLKRSISELKHQISNLGVVNVGAIEEYKEVIEKYTFMNSQKEDLVEAKLELIQMINEMTDKMKTVFNENLAKLKIIFNETFKELFKGGSADLILSEGDELTANIEINVEPPGKKLQNINLMSGGEKVLSAIALLFSILKMKPTPFCILDEIEAALDDANVLRYAEFLKKFSNNVQFIVITHRKGTMEVSDVLYGVTMEEKGISKVVSVDFNKHPYTA
ncbi:chromosome segregation protein SMC [Clostridium sp. YIM B02515]|uniref:Chromosome partition protein Smc n=1 Tax=Clostridium rhizosphaerae TaxID=2803861 RepID=A0ABS1T6F3_9CLOT|nr:chromosome segregation protein SMC [Clostridium rhizosphaerae]MBL4934923.1 chromosome segregation protein SMC [Clostridium rhizosphaerae]